MWTLAQAAEMGNSYSYTLTVLIEDFDFSALTLKESAIFEIVFDYDVCNGIKNKLDIVGVCCACEMCVDFLRIFSLVKIFKLKLNVCGSFFIRILTYKQVQICY